MVDDPDKSFYSFGSSEQNAPTHKIPVEVTNDKVMEIVYRLLHHPPIKLGEDPDPEEIKDRCEGLVTTAAILACQMYQIPEHINLVVKATMIGLTQMAGDLYKAKKAEMSDGSEGDRITPASD